jgi:hypothetical protein
VDSSLGTLPHLTQDRNSDNPEEPCTFHPVRCLQSPSAIPQCHPPTPPSLHRCHSAPLCPARLATTHGVGGGELEYTLVGGGEPCGAWGTWAAAGRVTRDAGADAGRALPHLPPGRPRSLPSPSPLLTHLSPPPYSLISLSSLSLSLSLAFSGPGPPAPAHHSLRHSWPCPYPYKGLV